MSDGILSQEEIDALLKGESTPDAASSYSEPQTDLSDFEKDTIGEIGNISMGTSATTLSTLLKKKVSITTPSVLMTTASQLQSEYPLPYVIIEVRYTEGIDGTNMLIIREEDASVIADLMMGGDGSASGSLDEIKISAVGEAMNQMMGSATTSLSSMFNKRIDIAPPEVRVIDLGRQNLPMADDIKEIVRIKFKMVIEGLVDSEIMQLMPVDAVRSMINILMGSTAEESSIEALVEPTLPEPPRPAYQPEPTYSYPPPTMAPPPPPAAPQPAAPDWGYQNYMAPPSGVKKGEQFAVQPVQFVPLQETYDAHMPQNIGLIMDVPLDVTVELGKARKTIKEVLELTQGSIIQLDKMAGEPVDLMVNGKLIAKGEVVVIDENYGIRITTILSPIDRMNKLQ